MSAGTVLIAAPVHPVLTESLAAAGYALRVAESITQAEAPALMADCIGVITSTRLLLDRALLDAAPRLQWIGRMGSGLEIIDVAYAGSRGIRVVSSPEGNCNAVAEHTLGLLLSLTKKIVWSAGEVLRGGWPREEGRGVELEGKTVGIIGYGHTGRAFARKLAGFEVRILAYDTKPAAEAGVGAEMCATLGELLEAADVISFHVPLRKDTHHYFNIAFAKRLKKPVILLNTSRGEVVEPEALRWALDAGVISAAGLDVWEGEPPARMSDAQRAELTAVASRPNVVLTPHIAGYSHEALYKMSIVLLDKLVIPR